MESSLYDVETGKPVWTMQTESVDPSLDAAELSSAVDVIFQALRDQRLP